MSEFLKAIMAQVKRERPQLMSHQFGLYINGLNNIQLLELLDRTSEAERGRPSQEQEQTDANPR